MNKKKATKRTKKNGTRIVAAIAVACSAPAIVILSIYLAKKAGCSGDQIIYDESISACRRTYRVNEENHVEDGATKENGIVVGEETYNGALSFTFSQKG